MHISIKEQSERCISPDGSEKRWLGNNIIDGSPAYNLNPKLLLIGCYEMMPVMLGLLAIRGLKAYYFSL